jgi:transcriptional regulator with XRE-family HTH domain
MKKISELSKTVRSLRLAKGMSCAQLAKKLKITPQAVSLIETGKTSCICKTKAVVAVCDFLGINMDDFEDSQPIFQTVFWSIFTNQSYIKTSFSKYLGSKQSFIQKLFYC